MAVEEKTQRRDGEKHHGRPALSAVKAEEGDDDAGDQEQIDA